MRYARERGRGWWSQRTKRERENEGGAMASIATGALRPGLNIERLIRVRTKRESVESIHVFFSPCIVHIRKPKETHKVPVGCLEELHGLHVRVRAARKAFGQREKKGTLTCTRFCLNTCDISYLHLVPIHRKMSNTRPRRSTTRRCRLHSVQRNGTRRSSRLHPSSIRRRQRETNICTSRIILISRSCSTLTQTRTSYAFES